MPAVKKSIPNRRNPRRSPRSRAVINYSSTKNNKSSKGGNKMSKSPNKISVAKVKARSRSSTRNSVNKDKNRFKAKKMKIKQDNIRRSSNNKPSRISGGKRKQNIPPVRKTTIKNRNSSQNRQRRNSKGTHYNRGTRISPGSSRPKQNAAATSRMKKATQRIMTTTRRTARSNSLTVSIGSRGSSEREIDDSPMPSVYSAASGDSRLNNGYQDRRDDLEGSNVDWNNEMAYAGSDTRSDRTWRESDVLSHRKSHESVVSNNSYYNIKNDGETMPDLKRDNDLEYSPILNSDENDEFSSDEDSLPVITINNDANPPKTILKNPDHKKMYEGKEGPHWSDWCPAPGAKEPEFVRHRSPKLINFRSKVDTIGERDTPHIRSNDNCGEACMSTHRYGSTSHDICVEDCCDAHDNHGEVNCRSGYSTWRNHRESSEDRYNRKRNRERSTSSRESSGRSRRHYKRRHHHSSSDRDRAKTLDGHDFEHDHEHCHHSRSCKRYREETDRDRAPTSTKDSRTSKSRTSRNRVVSRKNRHRSHRDRSTSSSRSKRQTEVIIDSQDNRKTSKNNDDNLSSDDGKSKIDISDKKNERCNSTAKSTKSTMEDFEKDQELVSTPVNISADKHYDQQDNRPIASENNGVCSVDNEVKLTDKTSGVVSMINSDINCLTKADHRSRAINQAFVNHAHIVDPWSNSTINAQPPNSYESYPSVMYVPSMHNVRSKEDLEIKPSLVKYNKHIESNHQWKVDVPKINNSHEYKMMMGNCQNRSRSIDGIPPKQINNIECRERKSKSDSATVHSNDTYITPPIAPRREFDDTATVGLSNTKVENINDELIYHDVKEVSYRPSILHDCDRDATITQQNNSRLIYTSPDSISKDDRTHITPQSCSRRSLTAKESDKSVAIHGESSALDGETNNMPQLNTNVRVDYVVPEYAEPLHSTPNTQSRLETDKAKESEIYHLNTNSMSTHETTVPTTISEIYSNVPLQPALHTSNPKVNVSDMPNAEAIGEYNKLSPEQCKCLIDTIRSNAKEGSNLSKTYPQNQVGGDCIADTEVVEDNNKANMKYSDHEYSRGINERCYSSKRIKSSSPNSRLYNDLGSSPRKKKRHRYASPIEGILASAYTIASNTLYPSKKLEESTKSQSNKPDSSNWQYLDKKVISPNKYPILKNSNVIQNRNKSPRAFEFIQSIKDRLPPAHTVSSPGVYDPSITHSKQIISPDQILPNYQKKRVNSLQIIPQNTPNYVEISRQINQIKNLSNTETLQINREDNLHSDSVVYQKRKVDIAKETKLTANHSQQTIPQQSTQQHHQLFQQQLELQKQQLELQKQQLINASWSKREKRRRQSICNGCGAKHYSSSYCKSTTSMEGAKKAKPHPRCPRPAFYFFSRETRLLNNRSLGDMSVNESREHAVELADTWISMSEDDKRHYVKLSARDKKRYESQMKSMHESKISI